jgi:hypothetical protein
MNQQTPESTRRNPVMPYRSRRGWLIVLSLIIQLVAGSVACSWPGSPTTPERATIAPGSKLNILGGGDHPWGILVRSDSGTECGAPSNHVVPPCSLLIPENVAVMHLEAIYESGSIYSREPRDGFEWYGCDEGPKSRTCTFTVTRPGGVCVIGVDPEVRGNACQSLHEEGVLERLPKAPPEYTRDPVSSRLMWRFPPGVCKGRSGRELC